MRHQTQSFASWHLYLGSRPQPYSILLQQRITSFTRRTWYCTYFTDITMLNMTCAVRYTLFHSSTHSRQASISRLRFHLNGHKCIPNKWPNAVLSTGGRILVGICRPLHENNSMTLFFCRLINQLLEFTTTDYSWYNNKSCRACPNGWHWKEANAVCMCFNNPQ